MLISMTRSPAMSHLSLDTSAMINYLLLGVWHAAGIYNIFLQCLLICLIGKLEENGQGNRPAFGGSKEEDQNFVGVRAYTKIRELYYISPRRNKVQNIIKHGLLGTVLPGFRSCNPPWLRLSKKTLGP